MAHFSQQNFYEILEVTASASGEEIRRAFIKAKNTYSPTSPALYSVFSEQEAEDLLKLIDEAYEILSNQEKRRDYDFKVLGRSPGTQESTPANNLTFPKSKVALPVNANKQVLSEYSKDPAFEKEIEDQTVFDGTFLQKVRLYKNISVDQISEASKISRSYIHAVEANDFHALPAAVFVRGFIQNISRLVGLYEKKVVDSYMKLYKDSRGNK